MKINWKIRVKSLGFWLGLVGALGAAVTAVCGALGLTVDLAQCEGALNQILTGVFTILALLGVAVDPTTKGLSDSPLALTYTAPKEDVKSK